MTDPKTGGCKRHSWRYDYDLADPFPKCGGSLFRQIQFNDPNVAVPENFTWWQLKPVDPTATSLNQSNWGRLFDHWKPRDYLPIGEIHIGEALGHDAIQGLLLTAEALKKIHGDDILGEEFELEEIRAKHQLALFHRACHAAREGETDAPIEHDEVIDSVRDLKDVAVTVIDGIVVTTPTSVTATITIGGSATPLAPVRAIIKDGRGEILSRWVATATTTGDFIIQTEVTNMVSDDADGTVTSEVTVEVRDDITGQVSTPEAFSAWVTSKKPA